MNRVVSFFAEGVAAPEGSHRYVGYRGGRPVAGWRTIVARAANDAARSAGWAPQYDGPVTVQAHFYLPRPKRPRFPDHAATKPDLDKLARAVGDALAAPGGILLEDSRIVTWVLTKRWASDGQPPGVHVAVTAIDD